MDNKIIIIRGPLGIGKTTVSNLLKKKLSAEYISLDKIVDDNGLKDYPREKGFFSQKSFLKANEFVLEIISGLKDNTIIIDGNFYWKSQIEDLIEKLGSDVVVFTLKASLDVCIERDAGRDKSHGEITASNIHRKTNEFDYGEVIEVEYKDVGEIVDEILNYLDRKP